jgi:RNA polymerase sigma-70 factor, ECF subfamily
MLEERFSRSADADSWYSAWLVDREEGMTALVRDHRRAIYARARVVCGDENAADVAQEVFLRMWEHPERFDPTKGSLRSFLVMMTHGIAVDHARANERRRRRDERSARADGVVSAGDPYDTVDPFVLDRLRSALAHLDRERREVIVAAYLEQLVHREIAMRMGIPEGTVKSRIRLGLRGLRADLKDQRESA